MEQIDLVGQAAYIMERVIAYRTGPRIKRKEKRMVKREINQQIVRYNKIVKFTAINLLH